MSVLTRVYLNAQTRGGRKLLSNRQAMHAAVMAAFPPDTFDGNRARALWRLDSDGARHSLYVLSPVEPDLTHLVEQAGWAGQRWDSTEYDRFLSSLARGQQWAFRLAANPVKAMRREAGRGKVVPHVTPAQQTAWLAQKAEGSGFALLTAGESVEPEVRVTERRDHRFGRADTGRNGDRHRVTLRIAQFDGLLEITDVERFRETLISGVGRAKAYGCGLMTLRRPDSL